MAEQFFTVTLVSLTLIFISNVGHHINGLEHSMFNYNRKKNFGVLIFIKGMPGNLLMFTTNRKVYSFKTLSIGILMNGNLD